MTERFTLFWNGPFSQWEPSVFVLDGVEYTCAEQFMMAEKARLFGDAEALGQILATADPRTQKAIGRQVRDFDTDVWEADEPNGRARCWNLVWRATMAKFSQNPHLLEALLATDGTTVVEASPSDRIWGIGLREEDPRARQREAWQGRNWLGEVVTDVRAQLQAQPGVVFDATPQLQELLDRVL